MIAATRCVTGRSTFVLVADQACSRLELPMYRAFRGCALGILLLALVPTPVLCQAANRPAFTARADLVVLGVSVTDASGACVRDLAADNFVVEEEGVRQAIALFSADHLPLDVTVLVDASASMIGQMPRVRRAAEAFVAKLQPDDSAAVFSFERQLTPISDDDIDSIRSRRGSTAIYDSLYVAVTGVGSDHEDRPAEPLRRRAVIVLTDGIDTASLLGDRDVLDAALRRNVTIYVILMRQVFQQRWGDPRPAATSALRTLTRQTGGTCYRLDSIDDLGDVYERIRRDVGDRYLLGYTPDEKGAGFRRVHVQVLHPGVIVRTRAGYIASGRPQSPK